MSHLALNTRIYEKVHSEKNRIVLLLGDGFLILFN